ncbi:protein DETOXIFICATION 44, chloroplastic isoform X2 [Brassica napus]|uniref:MATE efflux family protein 2, chloroplastic isoform X2 n=1 Tax=Brassica oleracea var. oleracea TaxID=109376 RepID=UPI0006A730E7|nr:PREDICTED: MATE efflux family protein 2, chloroplastic isoform X2 [Brassica oleracea var. oleracea]XP_013732527.2 protein DETOXIFICATION 44, chloroplastic isoform X2 [Brassica napus]
MAAVATFFSLSPLRSSSIFQLRDLPRNPNPSIRRIIYLKSPVVAASSKNSSPQNIQNIVESPEPDPDPKPEHGIGNIGMEIMSIALPAALALAADPITSLVDTAFVGHIGSAELAAVGVSVSVFNLVSKLFNVPLLNVTTSFVAEEQAIAAKDDKDSTETRKKVLPSVSTSLVLAAGVGIAEAIALSLGSDYLMDIMAIPFDSPMRIPAEQFLRLRAYGAPPIVVALAAQGAFRGFKDTTTPLYAVGNVLNAILDPILIFVLGFGISGAAAATVISEYLIAFILLWKLNENVVLLSPQIQVGRANQYLKSGGLLIGRTVALLVPFTLATSLVAQKGPTQMAGHQICLEIWLAVSLLTDALAIAAQSLLATSFSQGEYKQAREVLFGVLQVGLATGTGLAAVLFIGFEPFSSLFTTDSEVLKIALSGTLFVAGSQPVNAIAFVLDGLYYGVADFGFAAYAMVIAGFISSLVMLLAAPTYGLAGIWTGLFIFMALRLVAGAWRLGTRTGPWKMLWLAPDKPE